MSRAEPLYRLQLIDIDLDQALKQLRGVEDALASNPAVVHAQVELEAAQQAYHKIASDLRALELEAHGMDDKIKENEERLYKGNIHTPKELVDLQREVESLRHHRAEMEESMLTIMLNQDEASQVVQHCRTALDEATRHWLEDSINLRQERQQFHDRISADEERREAICSAIPHSDLEAYTILRSKKPNGVAVSLVRGGACGQCGESPSSVLLQQTRTGTSLTNCTTCGRILYVG